MRVLLDNNVNPRFAHLISGHEIAHAHELGWDHLLNGDLIATAESNGFQAIITADKNLRYQQNLGGRQISIVVLNSVLITLPHIRSLAPRVEVALRDLSPGCFVVVGPE